MQGKIFVDLMQIIVYWRWF